MHPFFGPDPAKENADFRAEVQRLSHRALLISGVIEFILSVSTFFVRRYLAGSPLPFWLNLPFIGIGVIALLAWRSRRWSEYSRAICLALAWATAGTLIWLDLTVCIAANGMDFAAMDLIVVLVVLVAILPATFRQMLLFGLGSSTMYGISLAWAQNLGIPVRMAITLPGVVLTALLCAVLAGLNYRRFYDNYVATRAAIDAEMRNAQAEYASTVARLSAAMSHELNTPLGSLRSAAESIAAAAAKHAENPQPRLAALQSELAGTIRGSVARISEVVSRMQRFTNLDRADVQVADLRQMLDDVSRLCSGGVRLEIPAVPPVLLQPAVVGGVLANLIRRAIERNETLHIAARPVEGAVELRIEFGSHLSLQPEFSVVDGRVAAANWELYQARQLLQSSGATVRLQGTVMLLSFPCAATAAAAM